MFPATDSIFYNPATGAICDDRGNRASDFTDMPISGDETVKVRQRRNWFFENCEA